MPTIFTRAKATRKVINLLEEQGGASRSEMRCDARLESDLGVIGDDAWEVLEAMREDGVDMSGFDCQDRITPEGTPVLPAVIWIGLATGLSLVMVAVLPSLPPWVMCTVAFGSATILTFVIYRHLPWVRHDELRVRDLIRSYEAGHWKSPKAEQDMGLDAG
jgi:hypothetical protein